VSLPRLVRAAAGPIIEETERRLRKESAESAEAAFRAAMARNPGVKTEWRVSPGDAHEPVRLSARCADLVVLGQRPTCRPPLLHWLPRPAL
jgi:hypothetical protein